MTNEVKETLCEDFKKERKRIFSAAQLWDIQRRKKIFAFKEAISDIYTKKIASGLCIKNERELYQNRTLLENYLF